MAKTKVVKNYNFCLWKTYFDTGYGVTSYLKYMIALFGISSLDVSNTIILGLGYGVFCLIFGKLWFKYKFADAMHEVQNRVNPFVREMRRHYK